MNLAHKYCLFGNVLFETNEKFLKYATIIEIKCKYNSVTYIKVLKIVPNINSDKYISAGCDCIAKY